jgi:molybdate transport system permease protein
MPLAIYSAMESPGGEFIAFRLVSVSILLSFAAMVASEFLNKKLIKKS